MKKIVYVISVITVLSFTLESCKPKIKSDSQDSQIIDADHNSKNSLDWDGVYIGTIPCADCSGINVQITLNQDETYQMSYVYLGKKDANYIFSGKFTWDDAGGTIILDSKDVPSYYKVGENKLIQLDMEGNQITGEQANMYVFTKNIESALYE